MFTKNNKGSSSSKSKFSLVRINADEFTHVNETSFSRPAPIEINSDTPIIPHEVMKDIMTSPDLNSTEVSPQEDNPPVGTSHPPIIPTRSKTKILALEHRLEGQIWFKVN
ncbi:hypothetical protein H5410_052380 [Solanum commersonii]|uniref:Uncharacterized protein n=1 Tax=Solanum commersonii TaxID=4109 RepID=A0A9J5X0P3_SOLCO|nr:hypothetical protein H5410_052380 [Solanum commersonii]